MRLLTALTATLSLCFLGLPAPATAHAHEGHKKPVAEVRDIPSRPDPDAKVLQVGGPFEMLNQNGETVTEKMLEGKYSMIFFGFTYCPDICPTELQTIMDAQTLLSKDQTGKMQIVFVSIDPARDTPAVIKDYLGKIGDGLTGLTGSAAQVATIAKAYKVYYSKSAETKNETTDYLMDHSGFVYLMGPDGKFMKAFSAHVDAEEMGNTLKQMIK